MIANREVFEDFWANLKSSLAALDGDIGFSGKTLRDQHPMTWLWAVVEMHITHQEVVGRGCGPLSGTSVEVTEASSASQREDVHPSKKIRRLDPQLVQPPKRRRLKEKQHVEQRLEEKLHNDGAASGLHLGFTLAGKRQVRFLQEDVTGCYHKVTPTIAKDVVLQCYPGHVYAGGVTGARHQVIHDEPSTLDFHEQGLLDLRFGPCSATFMLRSCIFPDRSRNMETTPNPLNVWLSFTSNARAFINDPRLRLPTFQEFFDAPFE